jgi:uncharacterized protein YggE
MARGVTRWWAAALLLAAGAAAQAATATPQRAITVTGEGEAAAVPDLAVVTLAVETEAKTAAEAASRNAAVADRVRQALQALAAARLRVSTSGYSLSPIYTQPEGAVEPEVRGYRAYNEVRVEVRELDAVGRVIDAAVAAGGNRVAGVSFSLERREAALREALAAAGREARAQAEAVAAALGVRLGAVASAQAGHGGVPPPMPLRSLAAMEMAATPTPIEPGEVTVRATLTVSFLIE